MAVVLNLLTHLLTRLLTSLLTNPLTHLLTHPLTHLLANLLANLPAYLQACFKRRCSECRTLACTECGGRSLLDDEAWAPLAAAEASGDMSECMRHLHPYHHKMVAALRL